MGNPFIVYKDEDPKSLAADYCRYNHQQSAPENVISRLQRNPFRRVVAAVAEEAARERAQSDPWLQGTFMRVTESQAPPAAAAVDPDRSDIDSMPELVTAQDWDRYMSDGDSDDDGGHIVDEYGLEEVTALLPTPDWLGEARPARQAFMPNLVAPELVESNVLAEWASQRRPRTRPDRPERPSNTLSADNARSAMPSSFPHAETLSLMRREWARQRDRDPAGSQTDNLANVRRVAREVLAQMDSRIAEMRSRARRDVGAAAEQAAAAHRMDLDEFLRSVSPSVRAVAAARRDEALRMGEMQIRQERAARAAADAAALRSRRAPPAEAMQSGAAQMRM